ncbi:uncharacterized protein LOC127013456 [Gymnogyps californianus]|uniref:uncharacterized protein LOC127013456 n=1 Tax=Gymnogyps californianus TaxID=33616 RepID=UPI0021C6822E|nr:uncharacterized protein LOC127013456 [Gymnogyps californianus]
MDWATAGDKDHHKPRHILLQVQGIGDRINIPPQRKAGSILVQEWQLGVPGAGSEFHWPLGFLHVKPLGWSNNPHYEVYRSQPHASHWSGVTFGGAQQRGPFGSSQGFLGSQDVWTPKTLWRTLAADKSIWKFPPSFYAVFSWVTSCHLGRKPLCPEDYSKPVTYWNTSPCVFSRWSHCFTQQKDIFSSPRAFPVQLRSCPAGLS